MSEKIWKIFGIFGLVCVGGILILIIIGILPGNVKIASRPQILEYTLEKGIVKTPTLSKTPERGGTKEFSLEIPSRMIIKTGWLNLVVKDVLEAIGKISKFVEENGGWVVSSNVSELEKIPSGSITVRVPAEKFNEAMNFFKNLATRVSNERIQAQDITEEYVDLEARLKNLKATEDQLLELMKRTGTISEILEVQRELTNIREQIEQIKGRIQYLEQSVKMSSITVNLALSEELLPVPPAEKWRPKYVLLQTWKNVLGFWKGFSYFLIRLIVWAQVWVPALIVILVIKKIWKKKKGSNV